MDKTLLGFLRALRTPGGSPPDGHVEWTKKDLFENETRVFVAWSENSLSVAGSTQNDTWNIEAHRTSEGWVLKKASPKVQGGTLFAKLRWAGKVVEEVALGATPRTSWEIPRRMTTRGMKR